MGLKSTLKLLLLFCSLNLILNQDTYNLNETIPLVITSKDAEKFSIQPNFNSKDYITIVYTPLEEGKKNPAIMVATNTDNCNSNRIALSTQYSGSIYIFLRKGQVDGKNADGGSIFAICTEKRESVEFGEYSIEVKLTNKAELPMGQLRRALQAPPEEGLVPLSRLDYFPPCRVLPACRAAAPVLSNF